MPAHVPSADYPSSWKVTAADNNYNHDIKLDQVTGAVFENGVYEGTLLKQIEITKILIEFKQKEVTLAEIELLGPRSALDALWPYGNYPCIQRLAVITSKEGPKKIFSRSKNVVSQKNLRAVFDATEHRLREIKFSFDGDQPVIIGAELPNLPMVQEVSIDANNLRSRGVKKVILQGSVCEPHCRKFGSKGWVRLAVGRPLRLAGVTNGPRIFVKNPGEYKAYRLKFIPRTGHSTNPDGTELLVAGISFLGCTA